MGSEGVPAGCTIHVTGFKKFYGVDENPTEVLALSLEKYIAKRGLQQRAKLGSVSVLEVAGEGALSDLLNLLQAYLPSKDTERSNEAPSDQVIWAMERSVTLLLHRS